MSGCSVVTPSIGTLPCAYWARTSACCDSSTRDQTGCKAAIAVAGTSAARYTSTTRAATPVSGRERCSASVDRTTKDEKHHESGLQREACRDQSKFDPGPTHDPARQHPESRERGEQVAACRLDGVFVRWHGRDQHRKHQA